MFKDRINNQTFIYVAVLKLEKYELHFMHVVSAEIYKWLSQKNHSLINVIIM